MNLELPIFQKSLCALSFLPLCPLCDIFFPSRKTVQPNTPPITKHVPTILPTIPTNLYVTHTSRTLFYADMPNIHLLANIRQLLVSGWE